VPLDAHAEVGNNALICTELGLEQAEPFSEFKGRTIGFVGRSADGVPFGEPRERCAAAFGQEPFVWDTGPELVHSVGTTPPRCWESADWVSSCPNGSAWSTGSWTFPIRSSQKTYAKSKKRLRCPRQALP
jgi:putative NIF3 family GTP cyclohydrolase 1 type 2